MADYAKVVKSGNGKQMKGIVDDGTKAIPIENKFGKKICTIYVRPGDLSIIDRYNSVIKTLPEIVKPLEKMDIKNDGTASLDDDWTAIKQVEEALYGQLNYLFDMDEAADIFATRNPFSSVNGRFFCETIMEVIGDIIAEGITEEAAKTQKRTQKYLDDLKEIEAQPKTSDMPDKLLEEAKDIDLKEIEAQPEKTQGALNTGVDANAGESAADA